MENKYGSIILALLVFIVIWLGMTWSLWTYGGKKKVEGFDTADEAIQNITSLIEKNFIFAANMIVMFHGTPDQIPPGWALCDGQNGTPDLRGRFIAAQDTNQGGYKLDQTGGTNNHSVRIGVNNLPPHSHSFNDWYFSEAYCGGPDSPSQGGRGRLGSGDSDGDNRLCGTGNRTNNEGRGQPINLDNRPAYYVLAFIMKLP